MSTLFGGAVNIENNYGIITINGGKIIGTTAALRGGAIYDNSWGGDSKLVIYGMTVQKCQVGPGRVLASTRLYKKTAGALYARAWSLEITKSTFDGNSYSVDDEQFMKSRGAGAIYWTPGSNGNTYHPGFAEAEVSGANEDNSCLLKMSASSELISNSGPRSGGICIVAYPFCKKVDLDLSSTEFYWNEVKGGLDKPDIYPWGEVITMIDVGKRVRGALEPQLGKVKLDEVKIKDAHDYTSSLKTIAEPLIFIGRRVPVEVSKLSLEKQREDDWSCWARTFILSDCGTSPQELVYPADGWGGVCPLVVDKYIKCPP